MTILAEIPLSVAFCTCTGWKSRAQGLKDIFLLYTLKQPFFSEEANARWLQQRENCTARWFLVLIRDGWRLQNRWIFVKVIFNPKIEIADFGPLNRAFCSCIYKKVAIKFYENEGRGVKGRMEIFREFICFEGDTGPLGVEAHRRHLHSTCSGPGEGWAQLASLWPSWLVRSSNQMLHTSSQRSLFS